MTTNEKLQLLRELMSQNNIDVYIIPSSDPHQSEDVDFHFKAREWISGFTGSAGTVVVSQTHAGLWTDSRYFIQAEKQLSDSEFVLHKVLDRTFANFIRYIEENYNEGTTVACDGRVFSYSQIESYKSILVDKGINLRTDFDLIDKIWENRPPLPKNDIFDHPVKYSSVSRKEKFDIVREVLEEKAADEYLISALDGIAWILNSRGNDIKHNPVFYSFGVLRKDDFLLFIDESKIDDTLKAEYEKDNIKIQPYNDIYTYLNKSKAKIYLDSSLCNYNLYHAVKGEVINGDDIINELKTIKNKVEIENIKKAHIADGVALTKFYIWLENELKTKTVSEYEAGEKLAYFRSLNKDYISESFGAIVGYKENGAIVHYSASKDNSSQIKPEGMLLIDSGGQYFTGTTDITRTTYFGNPTEEEKRVFTLVLKGHISLCELIFPEGTNGYQIDIFARQYLWENGLNYYHGTGHGVGFFLNVHEGPQGISSAKSKRSLTPLKPGMLSSNEPGYYKEGHFGIRIENLVLTVKKYETEFGKFFGHENVTMFPYENSLIDESILTKKEIEYLDNYHEDVFNKLSPYLNEEETDWLKTKCKNIK